MAKKIDETIQKARVILKLSKLGFKDEKSLQSINENIVYLKAFTGKEKEIIVDIKTAVKSNLLFSYLVGSYVPEKQTKIGSEDSK